MKAMHRLIVTSEAYKRSSDSRNVSNKNIDSGNTYLWHYPLRRLDAETLWDSIHHSAGTLDLKLGGKSFDPKAGPPRRGTYMVRGYSSNRDVLPAFLALFDGDDGRAPCPLRTHTVTSPQSLFLMNSEVVDTASAKFAERLKKLAGNDLTTAVDLGYRITMARPPSNAEKERVMKYLQDDPSRLHGFGWLLFNLDEFIFVR